MPLKKSQRSLEVLDEAKVENQEWKTVHTGAKSNRGEISSGISY
jgi:predicted DNA-binding ArsR family transcriptional regulator